MSIDQVATTVSSLLLIWQNPETRTFSKVGRLTRVSEGFQFEYLRDQLDPAFKPIHSFPDLARVYLTQELPAFFANRVMSRKRSTYQDYAGWLGVSAVDDAPFEVLARTGGGRETDTFHVVQEPEPVRGGGSTVRFFASGLRHIDGLEARLDEVQPGDRLSLRPEPTNENDPRAILIDVESGLAVGWVPAWLLDDVHEWMRECAPVMAVEQVNLDAPWHLRLLCRVDVSLPV